MLRCAITDRRLLAAVDRGLLAGFGDPVMALAAQAGRWAAAGVDWVQLREKDLAAGELERVAGAMVEAMRAAGGARLLVNGRLDVAMACGAAGVHLTGQVGELAVGQVRGIWPGAVVSVACHTVEEVGLAGAAGADFVVFGPVFEKPIAGVAALPGVGLEGLREACSAAGGMAVLALGGVTEGNAEECVEAGAAGIAGIRLFLGI